MHSFGFGCSIGSSFLVPGVWNCVRLARINNNLIDSARWRFSLFNLLLFVFRFGFGCVVLSQTRHCNSVSNVVSILVFFAPIFELRTSQTVYHQRPDAEDVSFEIINKWLYSEQMLWARVSSQNRMFFSWFKLGRGPLRYFQYWISTQRTHSLRFYCIPFSFSLIHCYFDRFTPNQMFSSRFSAVHRKMPHVSRYFPLSWFTTNY